MSKHSRLYPEILFHFTSREGLFGILRDNFTISYAREKIEFKGEVRRFGAPMVSFCDLRLSELKSHMYNYGSYGIGLRKEWANREGLSPVLYMNSHCPATEAFVTAVEKLYEHMRSLTDGDAFTTVSNSFNDIMNLYRYVKNYEGVLERKDSEPVPDFRFANEREWRFVPSQGQTPFPFVPAEKMDQKDQLNAEIGHLRLKFVPDDIQYLIVERDDERLDLIHHLEEVKGRFNTPTRLRLASRILTAEQINRDI